MLMVRAQQATMDIISRGTKYSLGTTTARSVASHPAEDLGRRGVVEGRVITNLVREKDYPRP